MTVRSVLSVLSLIALSLSPGRAHAESHHEILSQGPIKQRGKVVGWKATLLVDPWGFTLDHPQLGGNVRLGLGVMRYTDRKLGKHDDAGDRQREANAGVQPGYVIHQLKMREITGPTEADRGPAVETLSTGPDLKEVEVEVRYKDHPDLVPGRKVDLVGGFWKSSNWHIWGAAEGPVHNSTDLIVELPGKANTHSYVRAIRFLEREKAEHDRAAKRAAPSVTAAEAELKQAIEKYHNDGYDERDQAAMIAARHRLDALKAPAVRATFAAERIAELQNELDALIAKESRR